MNVLPRSRRAWLAVFLCVLLGACFALFQLPGESRFSRALQNSGHGLGFALLAFCSLLAISRGAAVAGGVSPADDRRGENPAGPGRVGRSLRGLASDAHPVLFAALFALGVAIEGLQHLSGRGASAGDLVMNVAGMIAGSGFLVAFRCVWTGLRQRAAIVATASPTDPSTVASRADERGDDDGRHLSSGTVAALGLIVGATALLWCLREPIVIVVVDALAPALPTLATFERPLALAKFGDGETPADLRLVEAPERWPANRTTVLAAVFPPGRWPGFRLIEPPPDWRGHDALSMTVANPLTTTVRLHVRVDQRTVGQTIFRSSFLDIPPGVNRTRIALRSMRPDPGPDAASAPEPFVDVSQILFFLADNPSEVTLLFDDLELSPQPTRRPEQVVRTRVTFATRSVTFLQASPRNRFSGGTSLSLQYLARR